LTTSTSVGPDLVSLLAWVSILLWWYGAF
jgi:hypothetical protein